MCFGFLCSRVPIFVFSCFVSMTCRRTRVLLLSLFLPPSLWVVLLTFFFPLIFPSVYVLSYFCVCVFMCVCVCLFVLLFNSFTLNRSLPPFGSSSPSCPARSHPVGRSRLHSRRWIRPCWGVVAVHLHGGCSTIGEAAAKYRFPGLSHRIFVLCFQGLLLESLRGVVRHSDDTSALGASVCGFVVCVCVPALVARWEAHQVAQQQLLEREHRCCHQLQRESNVF